MQQQIKLHNNFYNFLVKENLLEEYLFELSYQINKGISDPFYHKLIYDSETIGSK